jgi:hypothetical protein
MKNDSMLAAVAVIAAECARSRATPRNAVVVKASNGFARAWLCAWPDGRTTVALVAL